MGVSLNISPFLDGRSQFDEEEVIESQAIAQDRIHIERFINKSQLFSVKGTNLKH